MYSSLSKTLRTSRNLRILTNSQASLYTEPILTSEYDFSNIKLVTFDVTGTLLHFNGKIGELYARCCAEIGVKVDGEVLHTHFKDVYYQTSINEPFYGHGVCSSREWWRKVVLNSFSKSGYEVAPIFQDMIFDRIYSNFGTGANYLISPGTVELINDLRSNGVMVGILTNSDERYQDCILPNCGIDFDLALNSHTTNLAKPDPLYFNNMMTRADELLKFRTGDITQTLSSSECIHVGNDWELDSKAAFAAGWNSFHVLDNKNSNIKSIDALFVKSQYINSLSHFHSLYTEFLQKKMNSGPL